MINHRIIQLRLQKQHNLSTSVLITAGNLDSPLAAMNMPIRAIARNFSAGIELRQYNCQRRFFSVKELSWCAPNKSPVHRQPANATTEKYEAPKQDPIERFGVVAAMSKNRAIGVNGQIPWRLPEDRKIFKRLTKDGILIIGRRTFEEEPGQRHINHARHCIVISKSIDRVDDKNIDGSDRLRLAGSLDEALHQAKELVETLESHDGGLKCWVAGGERLYEEAIRHSSAQEIHLSVVDTDVDLTGGVVRFPAKHRWDQKFLESSQEEYLPMGDAPRFTYFVYRRRGSN